MNQYNIHIAKTHLSALVDKASVGDAFIIAKAGKPLVKVVPFTPQDAEQKRIGFLKGQIEVPDDFDRMGTAETSENFRGFA